MKIRQLYVFKTVCEEESITRAAEKLSMTQPAVSRTISELESALGSPLFERASRKVFINETGRLLLSKTIPLLELYEDLEESSQALERLSTLRIGSSCNIANYALPAVMSEFQVECADTPTVVTINNAHVIEHMLVHNQLDIALLEGVITHERLEKIPFSAYPLVVLCSPFHPLAHADIPTADRIAEEPLLLHEKGNAIRDTIDSAFMLRNISVTPRLTSVDSHALIEAVKHNLGITILPRILAEQELRRGELLEIPVQEMELSCVNHVVFQKDKFQTIAFQTFMNLVLFSESLS